MFFHYGKDRIDGHKRIWLVEFKRTLAQHNFLCIFGSWNPYLYWQSFFSFTINTFFPARRICCWRYHSISCFSWCFLASPGTWQGSGWQELRGGDREAFPSYPTWARASVCGTFCHGRVFKTPVQGEFRSTKEWRFHKGLLNRKKECWGPALAF